MVKKTKFAMLMCIAVFLAALVCAGAASADNWTDAGNFNTSWYESEGSGDIYHIYDAASLAALSEKVTINSTTSNFDGKTIVIMNDISLAGHDWVPIGTESNSFVGIIEGNNKVISDFSISGTDNVGLIGHYTGTNITNLTISNFMVSGSTYVGGLVGYAVTLAPTECTFENVSIMYGNVIGSSNCVGGLAGTEAGGNKYFVNCTAENCMIASTGSYCVGGLVGYALGDCLFDECAVKNSSLSGSGWVGGLVGNAEYMKNPYMRACNVTNCIVSAGSGYVGGLIGYASFGRTYTGCVIEQCTVVSADYCYVGGLVGATPYSYDESRFNAGNMLIKSAVRGNGTTVAKISGYNPTQNENSNVSQTAPIWLNNDSNADYPRIYIAKSLTISKRGPENESYFNSEGYYNATTPDGAQLVTQLTGYGKDGAFAALTYVFPPPLTTVTADTVAHGLLTVNPVSGYKDAIITVTATASPGYHLNWTYYYKTGAPTVKTAILGGTFALPSYNVHVSGDFFGNVTTVKFYNETGVFLESKLNTYGQAKNFTALPTKPGYSGYWNVSETGVNLNSYVTNGNWAYPGANNSVLNAYVNWTQNPAPAPQPSSSSSSRQTGGTIILQETVAPTVAPTHAPTAVPTVSPVNPTTLPTQKSPAPFVGLLAGLGVAALVLRLRK